MEKQTRTVTDFLGNTKEVDVFTETVTTTREVEWSIDSLESQITQRQNLVDNTLIEIQELQRKLDDTNAFNTI